MATASIKDAKNRLTELARRVEKGETVVVTRNGKPAFDIVPHKPQGGFNLMAIEELKRRRQIDFLGGGGFRRSPAGRSSSPPASLIMRPLIRCPTRAILSIGCCSRNAPARACAL